MMRITVAVAISVTCLASGALRPAHAAVATLLPPDASQLQAPTRRAIAELRRIVAARDLIALERHIAPDATMSFGPGPTGAAGLHEIWKPQLAGTALWRELAEILRLGGVETVERGGSTWIAPYPFSLKGDDPGVDPLQSLVVLGTSVALRAAPAADAHVIARVDHAVLGNDCEGTQDWPCVRWEGRPAYVHRRLVRSPVDYRLVMRVDANGWTITDLVAGD